MIRLSQREDETEIKSLWMASFGDSDAYISFFLDHLRGTYDCFVKEEKGAIVSFLFLLNCTLAEKKGKYIFAVCTDEAHRGRGHMSQLLNYVIDKTKVTTDFLCLVPSSKSLFAYYAQIGFCPYFYNTVFEYDNQSNDTISSEPLTFSAFHKIRSMSLSTVQWNINESQFLFEENLYNGGRNCVTPTGYAILRENDDVCDVIEWISDSYSLTELTALTDCKHLHVRAPVIAVPHLNGMIYILNPTKNKAVFDKISHPYLSLVLD